MNDIAQEACELWVTRYVGHWVVFRFLTQKQKCSALSYRALHISFLLPGGDKTEEGQILNGQGDDSFQDGRGEGEPAAAALED